MYNKKMCISLYLFSLSFFSNLHPMYEESYEENTKEIGEESFSPALESFASLNRAHDSNNNDTIYVTNTKHTLILGGKPKTIFVNPLKILNLSSETIILNSEKLPPLFQNIIWLDIESMKNTINEGTNPNNQCIVTMKHKKKYINEIIIH